MISRCLYYDVAVDLARIASALSNEPLATNLLLPIIDATDAPYSVMLRQVSERWPIPDFAPWDAPWVMARIEESISAASQSAFRVDDAIAILRRSVREMGFEELSASIYHYPARPQPAELWRRGIHIVTTRRPEQPQFGKTDWYGGPGIALVTINIWEDGLSSYQVLFHECGHAIHLLSIRTKYDSLVTALPGFFMEAVAMFFAGALVDEGWLKLNSTLGEPDRRIFRHFSAMQRLFVLRENVAFALQTLLLRVVGRTGEYSEIEQLLAARILYPALREKALLGHMYCYVPRWIRNETSAEDIVQSIWISDLISLSVARADPAGNAAQETAYKACAQALSKLLSSVAWDDSVKQMSRRISLETITASWRDRITQ